MAPPGTTAGADQGSLRGAEGRDTALDHALEELIGMRGDPPGVVAVVQRGKYRKVHAFGVRKPGLR